MAERNPFIVSSSELNAKVAKIIKRLLHEYLDSWYNSSSQPEHVNNGRMKRNAGSIGDSTKLIDQLSFYLSCMTQNLEARLIEQNWTSLLWVDIIGVFERHVECYNLAIQRLLVNDISINSTAICTHINNSVHSRGYSSGYSSPPLSPPADSITDCPSCLSESRHHNPQHQFTVDNSNIIESFFALSPHSALKSNISEEAYFRSISDSLLPLIMPSFEMHCDVVRLFCRALIMNFLKGNMNTWCEPDYIYNLLYQISLPNNTDNAMPDRFASPMKYIFGSFITRMISKIVQQTKVEKKSSEHNIMNMEILECSLLNLLHHILQTGQSSKSHFLSNVERNLRPLFLYLFTEDLRQYLVEVTNWVISPKRIHYYIQLFEESLWPTEPTPLLDNPRVKAEEAIITLLPDMLDPSIKIDLSKTIADIFSYKQLNKYLFINLLQVVLTRLFPELQSIRTIINLHRDFV